MKTQKMFLPGIVQSTENFMLIWDFEQIYNITADRRLNMRLSFAGVWQKGFTFIADSSNEPKRRAKEDLMAEDR